MRSPQPAGVPTGLPTTAALALGCLWALHAAAPTLPGRRFLPVLLAACITGFLAWRARRPLRRQTGSRSGVTAGLGCWFAAATLSTILNWQTDHVILTYAMVFVCGAGIFCALRGVTVSGRDIDIATAGLAAGALLPMMRGLLAFAAEWGVPDAETAISAWQNTARMYGYEQATFGNRGNTAGFLVIVTPLLFAAVLDGRRHRALRAFCAVTLVPIALNLVILQVRAAIVTLFAALIVTCLFKLGARRVPVVAAALVVAGLLLFRYQPAAGIMMTERLLPAVTVDTVLDTSVQGRVDAIGEGWRIARRNWLLGTGPGAALTVHSRESAHQFQVQQAMETGVFGLLGTIILGAGLWVALLRTTLLGRRDAINDVRFMLLIGPASFLTYAMVANAALSSGSVATWSVLVASMLALAPSFERRRRAAPAAPVAAPLRAQPGHP